MSTDPTSARPVPASHSPAVTDGPISARLAACSLGPVQSYRSLTLVPLLAEGPADAPYHLLDHAIGSKSLVVEEISERGRVPQLKVVNVGDWPVLMLDGEELVGAKQNRVLNLSVLAPARAATTIPVSCVEAGRWRATSRHFERAGRTLFATGRARKASQVSESLMRDGDRQSDQHDVWNRIARMSLRMGAESRTQAAGAVYERHQESLARHVEAFSPLPGQCGAVFIVGGRVAGLEIFDSPATFAQTLPTVVSGYALNAIDAESGATDDVLLDAAAAASVEAFLAVIRAAAARAYPAVGLGEDWRLESRSVAGGALVEGGRVVHFCAFPKLDDAYPADVRR